MKILHVILLTTTLLISSLAFAGDVTPPDVVVRDTFNEVMTIVKNDKNVQADHQKLLDLVETKIVPHINFAHVTKLAMGKYWRIATPEQQEVMVNQFRMLMVHTYSNVLLTFKDQKFTVKSTVARGNDVIVNGMIEQPNHEPITITYTMEKTPAGWKVYDVVVDGVSLVTVYRSTFSEEIHRSGIDGLIKVMVDKNQRLAEGRY